MIPKLEESFEAIAEGVRAVHIVGRLSPGQLAREVNEPGQRGDGAPAVSPLRRPLIAGNWKMHHGGASGVELAVAVARAAAQVPTVEVVVAPPLLAIREVVAECAEVARQMRCAPIGVAAQNVYPAPKGAFTGEVSAPMLREAGCTWVILGHSERRQYFGELDDFVAKKVEAALGAGLGVIACVGETLEERSAGKTLEVVLRMVDAVAPGLAGAGARGVIAYEPVWAIGTGKVATPADAQEVHAAIRGRLATRDGGSRRRRGSSTAAA